VIRLIAIDIDGTLLDSQGRLPTANVEAIHAAVSRGVHVALATGRSYPFARPVANVLPPTVSLIVSNGAIERGLDGTTHARRLLPRDVARRVLGSTLDHRHATALIFDRDADGQLMHESMDWEHPGRKGYWARNRSFIGQSVPLEDALVEDPIQVMFNGPVEGMRELRETLASAAEGFAVSLTEYVDRNFSLVDITAPEATKGRALAWRARQLGLTRDEVMAIGDNFNDLEMLEFAGRPVVMGNAVEALRLRGWATTAPHDDAGVAAAIQRFVLDAD
jgi:Cof subfamily protein (haloacid dehalogenase superfamily)